MSNTITRRRALAGASAALLLPLAGCGYGGTRDDRAAALFAHGIASGDPDTDSIVLWTRISGYRTAVSGRWELATDQSFRRPLRSGSFTTDAVRDFTCKVVAGGLRPGATYYYRFEVDGTRSPTGRTRTLPAGHVTELALAVVSCSNHAFGYFNVYEALARDAAIDFVLHLGDYIYEHGPDGYGGATGARIGRDHEPRHELVSLADYRTRHAQYKRDPMSQAAHAAHPLIATWDDHESANNPWAHGAENHQPATEGSWPARRAASLQAYYEWMPVRVPAPGRSPAEYWRHFRFGDLASLVTLETRHTARAKQIDYFEYRDRLHSRADVQGFRRDVLGARGRNMIADELETFVGAALAESIDAGRPWRLIGNQVLMARMNMPRLNEPLFDDATGDTDLANRKLLGELDLPLYTDSWDGYAWAREKFYRLCAEHGARDLLVLSGDSHSFWSNALFDRSGTSMGLELGTSAISSPGDFIDFGRARARRITELLAAHNDEVLWTDCLHRGYVRLQLTHGGGSADYVSVSNVLTADYDTELLRSVRMEHRDGALRYV
ncbi:MAG TPA: alkaline phosphatase D family protein [Woeseiaceae bacterium]|nr:alkaline phosphatase D family protein [Woeseiaceae bacterium]